METKHTKGEWVYKCERLTRKGNKSIYVQLPPNTNKSDQKIIVGYLSEDDCDIETCCKKESHANAKLIAASPELLEVCEKLLVDFIFALSNQGKALGWSNEKISEQIEKHPLIISSRNAIKKATDGN